MWDVLEAQPCLYPCRVVDDGLRPGDLLAGRYRLIDRIGSGGMAVIWRAHDETLDRLVAVKVLDLSLSGDERLRDLVRREAWAAARLNNSDVASVHDFVLIDGIGVLVMQLVDGEPLADRIAMGPMPWQEAVRIGQRVARVLEQAHSRSVVHRDITPDNIIVNGDRVTVLDFGIAARVGEPDEDSTGASFGTPAYVAPERLDGTPAQAATDIYALGVVLFEMITGRVPFKVGGWHEVASDHGPPPVPRAQGAPAYLGPLVVRMLAREPGARPSAAEVVRELQRPGRSRRLPLAVGALAVVAAAAATGSLLARQPPADRAVPTGSAAASASPSPMPAPSVSPSAPATRPSPTLSPTSADVRATMLALLQSGEADGTVRPDAALDLRQLIQNATQPEQFENVLTKIGDREREGSLDPVLAQRLRDLLGTLAGAV